jgi:hypothetical protein
MPLHPTLIASGLSKRLQKSGQVRSLFVAQFDIDRGVFAFNSNIEEHLNIAPCIPRVEILYIWKNVWLNAIDLHCHGRGLQLLNEAQSLAGWQPLDRRYIRIDTVPGIRMGTIATPSVRAGTAWPFQSVPALKPPSSCKLSISTSLSQGDWPYPWGSLCL